MNSNRMFLLVLVVAGCLRFWPDSTPPEKESELGPPPSLQVNATGDVAIRQFLLSYTWTMCEAETQFAQRVESGEFAGNQAQAAKVHKGLSDDALKAAQSAILERANALQDDRAAVVKYAREAATGWKNAYRDLSR